MNHFPSASLTGLWIGFAQAVFAWLMNPWLVVMPLLVLIFLPAWLGIPGWKLSWRNPLVVVLVIYWLALTPPVASLAMSGLAALAPADTGAPAEAIVVLSRPNFIAHDRYEQAIQLWRDRRAPHIFVTNQTNVENMVRRLRRDRLPLTILSGTACARTTQDEALSTAALLGEKGISHIILITDPPHLARAVKTFEGVGFSVIPHASPLPPTVTSTQKMALALRESMGLLTYAMLGRYDQGERLQHSPALRAVEVRQCKLEGITSDAELASTAQVHVTHRN